MNHRGVRLEHLREGWGQLNFYDLSPRFFQSLGGFMKRFLDVRVCQIYEGTSDVQKIIIQRALA